MCRAIDGSEGSVASLRAAGRPPGRESRAGSPPDSRATLEAAGSPMAAAVGTDGSAALTFSRSADMLTAVGLITPMEGGMAAVSSSAAAVAEARMLVTDIMLDMLSSDAAVAGITDAADESHPPHPTHDEVPAAAAAAGGGGAPLCAGSAGGAAAGAVLPTGPLCMAVPRLVVG